MYKKNKNIAIFGANGTIGSAILAHYQNESQVYAFSRSDFNASDCNLYKILLDDYKDKTLAKAASSHENDFFDKIIDYLWHMTLPIICSVISSFAVMTMLTKNSFIEEINKQYVLTARSKGLTENEILYKHVFKNALIPILTGFPAQFISAFFTGSILIETIFSLDGIGLLSYESILHRDYPVVLGTLFLFTLLGLVAKLLTDISYAFVDPRIGFTSVGDKRND